MSVHFTCANRKTDNTSDGRWRTAVKCCRQQDQLQVYITADSVFVSPDESSVSFLLALCLVSSSSRGTYLDL